MADVCPEVLAGGAGGDGESRRAERLGRRADAEPLLPAAVPHFDELEDVLGALDLLLLQPDHLHLLLAVLQDAELRFAVQQVEHLQVQTVERVQTPTRLEELLMKLLGP